MQQQPRLPLWFLIVNWVLILSAFGLGTYLGRRGANRLPDPQRSALELVYHEVLNSHIHPQDEHALLERAIYGMVDGLDEYSKYIPPQKVPEYDERSSGHYEGIGASTPTHGDTVVIHFPFPGGPAELAGLLPGDQILAVDGAELTDPENRRNVLQLVRGPADTSVQLRILRGEKLLDIEVARGTVQRPCVKWTHRIDQEGGLGYVYLNSFHQTAATQVFAAIEELERAGPLRGLILDLRENRGGSLDQCLEIARAFLPSGIIATQQRRGEDQDVVYNAYEASCRWPDLPLVVLVNEDSASASEVVTGALQDHKRAVVVGQRTFGKGHVNTVSSWSNHDFKLKLTTGTYRTPNGRNIQRVHSQHLRPEDDTDGGIFPDVAVEISNAQRRAIILGLGSIEPPQKHLDAYRVVAARYGFEVEAPPQADSDPQFAAAIDALKKRIKRE